ncbi:TPA: hypothetical protein ACGQ50_000868 [Enterobacter cloacae]
MNELDSRLRVDANGIILYLEENAMPARLEEWLRTPEGAVWGLPSWGNPMRQFQHEPTNDYTAVAVENYIIGKLGTDIPEMMLMGIRCNALESDMYQVLFYYQNGFYEVFMQRESAT